jgi:hypothetical protein
MVKASLLRRGLPIRSHLSKVQTTTWLCSGFLVCISSAFCAVTTPSQAAPILLVEFSHPGFAFRAGPAPSSVPFIFGASDSPPDFFIWEDSYSPSDIGRTFSAPPTVVSGAIDAIHSPTTRYASTMAEISVETYQPSQVACGRCNILVPVVSWPTYTVTSVHRVIDNLVITDIQGIQYTVQGTHRIQLWGVLIPEPNAIAQLLGALILGSLSRRIACDHRRPRFHSPYRPTQVAT